MKVRAVVVIFAAIFCFANAIAFAQQPKPLSSDTIIKLLSAQVYSHRIEALAQELHVDFQVTPGLEKQFRALGANDELLETLKKSYQPSTAAPPSPKPATPAELAIQHYRQGEAYFAESKWDDAVKEYQTAIKLKPDNAEAYGAWGFALATKGNVDGAITEYQRALRLAPKDYEVHNNLGAALSAKGDVDGAIREYREALRLAPNDAQAHNNLEWRSERKKTSRARPLSTGRRSNSIQAWP